MTKYGSQFSATDDLKKADGRSHNAPVRAFKNKIDLATDGGTAQPIKIAQLPPGMNVDSVTINTDANLSALNFTIGTATSPAKYGAASAGPNATQKIFYPPLALGLTCNDVAEEILLTPSGAMPGAGTMLVRLNATGR